MPPFFERFITGMASSNRWVRYGFAFIVSIVGVVLRTGLDTITRGNVTPFIPSFAAVVVSAVFAGGGPGLLSAALLTLASAMSFRNHGYSWIDTSVLCGVFFIEGVIICFVAARASAWMRNTTDRVTWHRQLVDTSAEGIWVHDNAGTITYANARMAEILGVARPEDLIGLKTEQFFFPADVSMERIRSRTLTEGLKEQFDRRLRRRNGTEVWALACCSVTTGPEGEVTGALAMMTDITERKAAENALRRSETRYRNLFEGVLEGVYQSTRDGRILAANPFLLKMLGIHDTSELSELNIARDLYVDPNIRPRLLEQLERTGVLINVEYELQTRGGETITVLENARVVRDDAGAVLYYEGTLTDISERKRYQERLLRAQKIEALGRLAGGIAQDFHNALTVITGHASLMLGELPPSEPVRRHVENLTDAAERALALTRQLIAFSRHPDRDADLNGAPSRETILLVDDEPLIRELSRDMLERQGYRVIVATDPVEAERIGRSALFDLLIAETAMPGMTGAELARRLRSARPGLKVLFISGYTEEPLDREDLSGGAAEVLQKPFSADSLGRKIRQLLDGESSAAL